MGHRFLIVTNRLEKAKENRKVGKPKEGRALNCLLHKIRGGRSLSTRGPLPRYADIEVLQL
jgi:hypothetical protein